MKQSIGLASGLLMLVLAVVGMSGCESQQMTGAQITARNKQLVEAHPDFWRNRLKPESEMQVIGPIPIGDKRVTVKARHLFGSRKTSTGVTMLPKVKYDQYREFLPGDGACYELVDADTGKVILPLDYWEIVPVPGVGVFVHSPYDRLDANDARFNSRPTRAWHKLDLTTGQMTKTDVILAQAFVKPQEDHGYGYTPDPFKRVSVLGRVDPASTPEQQLTQIEIYPIYEAGTLPVTEPLIYGRVMGKPMASLFTGVGKYTTLAGLDENNRPLTLLLDDQLRYILETDQPVRKFSAQSNSKFLPSGSRAMVSFLATTAPGTNISDDLWVILDENAQFGAPPDVVGYRPFNERWKPDEGTQAGPKPFEGIVERWMVRKRTDKTTPFTDDSNGVRVYNTRWTMINGDFSTLGHTPHMWDYQMVRVPWIDRHQDNTTGYINEYTDGDQYERVFMACLQKENWTIVDPMGKLNGDRAFTKVFAQIDSPANMFVTLTAMHQKEVAFRAKLQQAREAYIAKKAEEALAKRRAWINENWQKCLNSGNYKWCYSVADERGGNSWYEIARSMQSPTVEFVQQVMERTPAEYLQKDLNAMLALAKQREAQARAEYWARDKEQKRLRWLAANPRDPASSSSYSGGGSSSRSSTGGSMTSGWQVSDSHKQAYMKALGTSQHRSNMGWSNPYAY